MLQALDVLPCDADVDDLDGHAGIALRFFHGKPNGLHRALDVCDDTAVYTDRLAAAVAEDFDLAVCVLAADEAGNLRGTDVEAHDDFVMGWQGLLWHG